jgi:rSAM/selenodomain-associated transferase 2
MTSPPASTATEDTSSSAFACHDQPDDPHLSILIPVLNDADALQRLLACLVPVLNGRVEILVVDGGSHDASREVARRNRCALVEGARGRGVQLALGAARARGRWLWMLHADSLPDAGCVAYLCTLDDCPGWGRFAVRIDGGAILAVIAWMMNRRSCVTGICTGDQGIFVHRELLRSVGGMPTQPLMEDIELSRRLKRCSRPRCRRERVATSARRWLAHGVARTIVSMWWYRFRYWYGADAEQLAREYYR